MAYGGTQHVIEMEAAGRYPGGDANVLSGLMRNPDQTRNRPMVVDAPAGDVVRVPAEPLRSP